MSKQIEALKMALESLEDARTFTGAWPAGAKAITAISEALAEQPAQQDSETITQNFTGLPKRKLRDLLSAGWQINGVCFQRTEEDGKVRRGAATTGGMVLWWNQDQPAQPSKPLTDEQRKKLRDAFALALTDVYVCGRVWEAWQYGTMSEGDFQPAGECEEVLDSLIEATIGIKE